MSNPQIPESRIMPDEIPALKISEENDRLPAWQSLVLDEREQGIVQLAKAYEQLGSFGAPNHLFMVVVAKMATLLDSLDLQFEVE